MHMQTFVKLKSSRIGEITLSITDIGKSCTSREFLVPLEYLLTLFGKIYRFAVTPFRPLDKRVWY